MKKFLEKHILFPKQQGLQPYLWLLFLLPVFAGLANYVLWQQLLMILLILIFMKAYRDGYWQKHHARNVAIQLIIASFLTANPWFSTFGLQTFTGFEIGFSPVSERRWHQYLWAYYVSSTIAYGIPLIFQGIGSFTPGSIAWIIVGIAFSLLAPLFAKSMSRSYDLSEQNKQLENKIRQLERERIAYDLHDNLGQTFSTISLQAELVEKLIEKNPRRAKEETQKIAENSRQSLNLVREIVSGLREQQLASILEEAKEALALAQMTFEIKNQVQAEKWPVEIQTLLAAVLKEALTNSVRHSQARQVKVSFSENHQYYLTEICDDGKGLGKSQQSHGMNGMKQRIHFAAGSISFASENGVKIRIKLPKGVQND